VAVNAVSAREAPPVTVPASVPEPGPLARYERFEDVVALVRARRDMSLLIEIETGVRLARYAPGRIEFEPSDAAPPDLAARLAQRLQLWTGVRWGVAVVGSGGAATIAETRAEEKGSFRAQAMEHPMVQAVLAAFPGAEIRDVRPADALDAATPAAVEAAVEEDDDWDPFDPFSEES
jgi:DNA polymerase-3 subunit gamma/tau